MVSRMSVQTAILISIVFVLLAQVLLTIAVRNVLGTLKAILRIVTLVTRLRNRERF